MTDRYALFGAQVEHSLSPRIHGIFARQCAQDMTYDAIASENFEADCRDFFANGGCGCNITAPHKARALALAERSSARAREAGAANCLWLDDGALMADNTDGEGLVCDLQRHRQVRGRRVLVLGAGGAAAGIVGPLLQQAPGTLCIANRTAARAADLVRRWHDPALQAMAMAELESRDAFDIVICATSASMEGQPPRLPQGIVRQDGFCYDLCYGKPGGPPTAFVAWAARRGLDAADGLGMLVEQAALSFALWRGVRPDSRAVLQQLRS